jgi:ATP-dependent Lhr-like helicase
LLLPKRRPGFRTPLWQQRQKAATLLQVAAKHPTFPIVLETYRECLQDVFDLPALSALLARVRSGEVRVVETDTDMPSPFATSLQLAYMSAFMYEGDAPLAERRAHALALDRSVLAELMGREELRELLDAEVLTDLELELQCLAEHRKARDGDGVQDLLRRQGDLAAEEVRARVATPEEAVEWLGNLERERRVARVRITGHERYIAVEDAARYRDGLGVVLPNGLPQAFLEPVPEPLDDLAARFARTRGPFTSRDLAARFGLGVGVAGVLLERLAATGQVLEGEFRPGGCGREWIDADVLRRLRRQSLARLRREVEPVPQEAYARFAVAWQELVPARARHGGTDGLWRVIERLQGVPLPASALESQILRARLRDYNPGHLDQLGLSGDVVWIGCGALGAGDGWVVLAQADKADLLLPPPLETALSPLAQRVRDALERRGALFFRQLAEVAGGAPDAELLHALWELVWAGWATNDTLAPLRALVRRRLPKRDATPRRPVSGRAAPPAATGRWSLAPRREPEATRRMHAWSEQLLRRYGIVTRGAAISEKLPGGFGAVYPVLKVFEESGRCRRGYFVDGLGGAQFGFPGAIDRLRAVAGDNALAGETVVLAATDPANPYGSVLPWPERGASDAGHRAGRKAGASVVLVDGKLVLYVERGGKSMLSYTRKEGMLRAAVDALARAARSGFLGRCKFERVDGTALRGSELEKVLVESGFRPTYRGLELRA